jgi:hypothetical protein
VSGLLRGSHGGAATVEDIQPRLIQRSLHFEQSEHRMKQVVMAQIRLITLALQTTPINPFMRQRTLTEPHHHRHMRLRLGRQCIRRGMQVQAVFAQ